MSSNYISEVLKSSRKGSNLSVNEVVDKLSSLYGIVVASKTLYGWEKDRSQPDIDTFLALCKIYNISNDDFLMIGKYLCESSEKKERFSHEACEVAEAYDKASFKDRNTIRMILSLPLMETEVSGIQESGNKGKQAG